MSFFLKKKKKPCHKIDTKSIVFKLHRYTDDNDLYTCSNKIDKCGK